MTRTLPRIHYIYILIAVYEKTPRKRTSGLTRRADLTIVIVCKIVCFQQSAVGVGIGIGIDAVKAIVVTFPMTAFGLDYDVSMTRRTRLREANNPWTFSIRTRYQTLPYPTLAISSLNDPGHLNSQPPQNHRL
jgi:hypothetical protein